MIFAYSLPDILLLTLFTSSNYFSFEMHLKHFKYLPFEKDASHYLSKTAWMALNIQWIKFDIYLLHMN